MLFNNVLKWKIKDNIRKHEAWIDSSIWDLCCDMVLVQCKKKLFTTVE